MRGRFVLLTALCALAGVLPVRLAFAAHKPPAAADVAVQDALLSGQHSFCTHPPKLLDESDTSVCPLAKETAGCEPLAAACDKQKPAREDPKPEPSTPRIPKELGSIAMILTVLIVLAVLVGLLVPVLLAYLRSRRDGALRDLTPAEPAAPTAPLSPDRGPVITDAERLLALANDLAACGQSKEALGTYLTASLRALSLRGVIRFARHRTNGEYVRSCAAEGTRAELSAVVREVEAAEFGGREPSAEAIAHVRRSATALVRAAILAASILLLAIFSAGCDAGARARTENDPAGKQLLLDVLSRQGLQASYLSGSIGSLPIPQEDDLTPLVILDLSVTKLDEEARAHVLRWVRAGGVLLALEPRADMEETLAVETASSKERDVTVLLEDPYRHEVYAYPARVSHGRTLRLRDRTSKVGKTDKTEAAEPLTRDVVATVGLSAGEEEEPRASGATGDDAYAIAESLGRGAIVTVASADLFTNVGLSHGENAKAAMALVERALGATRDGNLRSYHEHPIAIARREAGMTPPGNPLSALSQAGLGLGLWHALAAALCLFLAVGARQARAKPAPPPARRAFAEHVEATGALYAKAHAASHARAVLAKYTDERVRQKTSFRLAVPSGSPATPADDPFLLLTGKSSAEYKELVATDSNADEMTELRKMRELRRVLAKVSSPAHSQSHSRSHPGKKDHS